MSEKSKIDWRKVKEVAIFGIACIPIVLLSVAFVTVALIIVAAINGAIVSVCWNTAMTTMFGFSKVTMFQAFVLAYTIGSLRTNYYNRAKSEYEELKKEKIFEEFQNKRTLQNYGKPPWFISYCLSSDLFKKIEPPISFVEISCPPSKLIIRS